MADGEHKVDLAPAEVYERLETKRLSQEKWIQLARFGGIAIVIVAVGYAARPFAGENTSLSLLANASFSIAGLAGSGVFGYLSKIRQDKLESLRDKYRVLERENEELRTELKRLERGTP